MVQENVFTYVLGFVEKNNVLMQKNGLLTRTSYQIKPLRLKTATSWRAWSRKGAVKNCTNSHKKKLLVQFFTAPLSRCRTPVAETQCFRRRLLVGLVANIGRGKDGSDRRKGHPRFETFISVCCALFLCTFSLCSRFWSCWQKLSSSPCLSTVWVSRGFET